MAGLRQKVAKDAIGISIETFGRQICRKLLHAFPFRSRADAYGYPIDGTSRGKIGTMT